MKYIINIKWLLLLFIITLSGSTFAQGIRKHYTELNDSERIAYKTAIENLKNLASGDVIEEYAGYHADPDDDGTNGNIPPGPNVPPTTDTDSPIHNVQEFLSWHRQFVLEFERELQNQNEYLTIPYWDWTGTSDPSGVSSENNNSPLWTNNQISSLNWSNNFLGQYNVAWNLNRTFSGSLPTSSQVSNILASTTFSNFRGIEGSIHSSPHVWVGGQMRDILFSPRDPIFYFHHAMVDKIWQDWEMMPNNNSSFTDNVMPTFDGTVTGFDFVNQNSIVDSRTLGVFYSDAINQVANLEMYAVTNNTRPSEKFVYQYKIEAKDDFLVPSGGNAEFRSCKVIELLPGFTAEKGAVFEARIDNDCDFSTAALVDNTENSNDNSEDDMGGKDDTSYNIDFKNYPNPFNEQTTIEFTLTKDAPVTLLIFDSMGRKIATLLDTAPTVKGTHQVIFDGTDYPSGVYYYSIQAGEFFGTQKMTLIK